MSAVPSFGLGTAFGGRGFGVGGMVLVIQIPQSSVCAGEYLINSVVSLIKSRILLLSGTVVNRCLFVT